MAFNAKNLTYEAHEPAFLRRLKRQHAPEDGARPVRQLGRPERPKRLQMGGDDEEDDVPTYVDGDTNEVISTSDYRRLVGRSDGAAPDEAQGAGEVESTPATAGVADVRRADDAPDAKRTSVAQVGERRRKRAAKMVGDDEHQIVTERASERRVDAERAPQPSTKPSRNTVTKNKKIKLSFDDHDET